MDSILTHTKQLLGMTEDYEHFDVNVISHINSAFMILTELGVGPEEGFRIEDESAIWEDFIPADNKHFEAVKDYIYLKCKIVFDNLSPALIASYKEVIKEYEWRFNVTAETL